MAVAGRCCDSIPNIVSLLCDLSDLGSEFIQAYVEVSGASLGYSQSCCLMAFLVSSLLY